MSSLDVNTTFNCSNVGEDEKLVFILMHYEDKRDEIYDEVVKPMGKTQGDPDKFQSFQMSDFLSDFLADFVTWAVPLFSDQYPQHKRPEILEVYRLRKTALLYYSYA
jgi:hypothetical protein